jgi:hypothetical protein
MDGPTSLGMCESLLSLGSAGSCPLMHRLIIRVNVREGEASERPMTTGLHIVRDIFCIKCDANVGWKYV